MQIDFLDSKLRKLCENNREAEKKLGSNCARKLRSRLSDLEAVAHVRELNAGRPHPLERDRLGQFALDLAVTVKDWFLNPTMSQYPKILLAISTGRKLLQ